MARKLSLRALSEFGCGVSVPEYDPARLTAGIVHIGVGNFFRAHLGVYLHRLFQAGRGLNWAVAGASTMPADKGRFDDLRAQDCLTTVVEQSEDGETVAITGSTIELLEPGDNAALIARLADPAIRIVSLTITEGGYFLDPTTDRFHAGSPAIARDATAPAVPETVFGVLVYALRRRRDSGAGPFTVLSCDNLPHNGAVARTAVTALAGALDPVLADWIETHVSFPNSMVDRITPATTDEQRAHLRRRAGLDDSHPVFCEDYLQWVLEDDFCAGRPELETVGVEFVDDVTPYENMKLRILNGGHAAIGYPAALLGYELVHEAMGDPLIRGFLTRLERDEILPIVPPVPNTSLEDYLVSVTRRLCNPGTRDQVARLCQDGSNRQPKFIVPTIADRLGRELSIKGISMVSALWCQYCLGVDESGREIAINDEDAATLRQLAIESQDSPERFLRFGKVFSSVADDPVFRAAFAAHLRAIRDHGVKAFLAEYLSSESTFV